MAAVAESCKASTERGMICGERVNSRSVQRRVQTHLKRFHTFAFRCIKPGVLIQRNRIIHAFRTCNLVPLFVDFFRAISCACQQSLLLHVYIRQIQSPQHRQYRLFLRKLLPCCGAGNVCEAVTLTAGFYDPVFRCTTSSVLL